MTEETPGKLKILAKLHLIMSDVERIAKDAKNAHQNYQYASEKAIKETMHPLLVKHKVVFQISAGQPLVMQNSLALPIDYCFYDVDSGEVVTGYFQGSGQIRDDKGIYAAVTGAIKYILTSTFLIPTGDDPERDDDEPKGKTRSPKQAPIVPESPLKSLITRINVGEAYLRDRKIASFNFPSTISNQREKWLGSDNLDKATEEHLNEYMAELLRLGKGK